MVEIMRGIGGNRVVAVGALILCLAEAGSLVRARSGFAPLAGLPRVMLWAWERKEDLRGLRAHEAGVAFLAATFVLQGDAILASPRRQPLLVDSTTGLMAVARIETDRSSPPVLSAERAGRLAVELGRLVNRPNIRALQIDFDATLSERDFYRGLIDKTRRALGSTPLSITALTSWCGSDDWIRELAVDEAVPMLFRLGIDRRSPLVLKGANGTLPNDACAAAVGISTDEPIDLRRAGRRVYVFHSRGWTPATAKAAISSIGERK